MKINFADRIAGFGAFMAAGTVGTGITVAASALGAGSGSVGVLGLGAAASALTAGFVVTRVSAKVRSVVSSALRSVAIEANIDPDLVEAVSRGPVSALRHVAEKTKRPQNGLLHEPPIMNIHSMVKRQVDDVSSASVAKETVMPEKDEARLHGPA